MLKDKNIYSELTIKSALFILCMTCRIVKHLMGVGRPHPSKCFHFVQKIASEMLVPHSLGIYFQHHEI